MLSKWKPFCTNTGGESLKSEISTCTEYSQYEQRKYTTTTTETLIETCNITRP